MKYIKENDITKAGFDNTLLHLYSNELDRIKHIIATSHSETDLKDKMRSAYILHFMFGFGGHHMWVKQLHKGEIISERILLVRFE
jgi:hypothetical protein